jgi:pimeloyl-ACP methyl ester carboxylesterase
MSIYRSIEGKTRILKLYDENWAALNLELEHYEIATRYGQTHVVATGPRDGQPVVVFHGGNMISPISFAWITTLTKKYRIYAPDTVGHPGYSAETRLDPGSFQYGEWASDVLDGLQLDQPVVMGGSYGAGILLNLAAYAPQKIGKGILVVPSGFAPPPLLPLVVRIGIPMILYQLTKQQTWLVRSLEPMYPQPSETVVEVTGEVYRSVKVEAQMPRSIRAEDLSNYHAPTIVLAADKDILFPGSAVIRRAREVIPNLVAAEMITGSTHFLPSHLWNALCERIDRFIQTNSNCTASSILTRRH